MCSNHQCLEIDVWIIQVKLILDWMPEDRLGKSTLVQVVAWCRQHDDVIKWKHFPRYWPFVRGIHRSPVISPHKGQWRGALMFSLICVWTNGWVNNCEAGDLRRYRAHHDVTVMREQGFIWICVDKDHRRHRALLRHNNLILAFRCFLQMGWTPDWLRKCSDVFQNPVFVQYTRIQFLHNTHYSRVLTRHKRRPIT